MKSTRILLALLFFTLYLTSCSKDEGIVRNENTLEIPEEYKDSYLNTTIKLDGVNVTEFYKDCYVNSIYDECPISSETMKLESNINKKVQTYFLTDKEENIYMMTRVSDTEKNKNIDFSEESTTLAFITFHPFFAHIDSLAYDILEEAITNSQHYSIIRTEINKIIKQKQDIFNQNNTALYDALDLLLDELIVFSNYKPEEDNATRAIKNETSYYPFRLNSNGKRLDFQVFGLNPNYYGTATHANGTVENIVVKSHEDFGFLAGLESIVNILNKRGWDENQYGEIKSYTFAADGECMFQFSCNTKENQIDLMSRLLSTAGDMLGVDVDKSLSDIYDLYTDVSIITQEVNNASYELGMTTFPYFDIAENIVENHVLSNASDLLEASIEQSYNNEIAVYEKLKSTTNDRNLLNAYNNRIIGLQKAKVLFKKVMGVYTITKGAGNMAVRLIAAYRATNPVSFNLCCYKGEIHNCTNFRKYKGDNQTGIYGLELVEPISVSINVNVGKLSDYIVKFEVCKGGGTIGDSEKHEEYIELGDFDYTVSTKWTLGADSEEQIVRAYLCEKDSKEEVCEPVEFKATALSELLSIYIEKIEYEESPSYHSTGIVKFTPSLTVCTDETEKLDMLYDWGLIIYEEVSGRYQKTETIQMGIEYTSIEFSRTFKLNKTELNLDYNNYIAKNNKKYSIGSYVIYKEGGEMVESDVLVPIELIYDQKPSLAFTNLYVSPITSTGQEGMDSRISYNADIIVQGALWMDYSMSLYYDSQENQKGLRGTYYPLHDGIWGNKLSNGFTFPSGSPDPWTDWEYLVTNVNGKELKSVNCIYRYWHGPIMEFSLRMIP